MGHNGTHPKREGGVSRYWDFQGGVEGMRSSGELSVEAGVPLAQRLARVQSGTGNRDVHTGGQVSSTDSWDITLVYLPSVFRHPQGVCLHGKGSMPLGYARVWNGAKPGPTPHVLLEPVEDCSEDE